MPSVTDEELEPGERLVVGGGLVLAPGRDAASCGVLRADTRVVEPGADRVGLEDLAVLVLQVQRAGAVQHAGHAAAHRRAVLARSRARARRLRRRRDSASVSRKPAKVPDRVRTAADARDHEVGVVAAEDRAALLARLVADDALELAHHPRVRVRADDRADAVVRALDRRDPVAQRLVDRVLERARCPDVTGTTSAPSSFMRNTLSAWRSTSTAPMNTMQSRPNSAAAVAVATPCWPAPVSAMTRCLPMRRVSSAWPSTLLILCEPVWVRSSRLSSTRTPRRSERRWHSVTGVGRPA